jgi:hypothetical protein
MQNTVRVVDLNTTVLTPIVPMDFISSVYLTIPFRTVQSVITDPMASNSQALGVNAITIKSKPAPFTETQTMGFILTDITVNAVAI